jgi:hypothetical protein
MTDELEKIRMEEIVAHPGMSGETEKTMKMPPG